MRVPKQVVWYSLAYHDEDEGTPFCLDGQLYRSKDDAMQELKKYRDGGRTDFFVAKVIIQYAESQRKTPKPQPSKRKAA